MKTERPTHALAASLILALCAVTMGGCDYDFPAVENSGIAIDKDLLGRWQAVDTDENEDPKTIELLVLPYNASEYLVQYPVGPQAAFFRAYHVQIGTVKAVQLEALGTARGPFAADVTARFTLVAAQRQGDKLDLWLLNKDALGTTPTSGEELRGIIRSVADHPDLFHNPVSFRRCTD